MTDEGGQSGRRRAAMQLVDMSLGLLRARLLYVAAELGVADQLKRGSMECAEIAHRVGVEPAALYRVLRALASLGIFEELGNRRFALNSAALPLRSEGNDSVRQVVRYLGKEWHVRTMEYILHSVRTGATAFELAHRASLFSFLESKPAEADIFDPAMSRLTGDVCQAVLEAYDFSGVQQLVDVGGGDGQLLRAIIARYPNIRGVLYEKRRMTRLGIKAHDEFSGSIEVVPGDFFEKVPDGADAYVLKSVIHDWDSGRALRILENCRDAMGPRGRVILIEAILGEKGAGAFGKVMDVGIMLTTGGAERTLREYEELLHRAGLKPTAVSATASPYSVIEARLPKE